MSNYFGVYKTVTYLSVVSVTMYTLLFKLLHYYIMFHDYTLSLVLIMEDHIKQIICTSIYPL